MVMVQGGLKLYLLFNLNSFGSPGRSTAESVENGDFDGNLFSILVAYQSERHADSAIIGSCLIWLLRRQSMKEWDEVKFKSLSL